MLSKILRGEDAAVAQPVPWARAAGTGTRAVGTGTRAAGPLKQPSAPAQPVAANPQPAASNKPALRQITTTDDQVAVLLERVNELERTMEQRVSEARDAAYREAELKTRTQITAQIEPVLEKLARSIHELSELRSKLRHQAEGDLIKLSLAIARKVVHRELSTDPESLAGLVRVAMEKIRFQEILRVRVHPQHQSVVQQLVARFSGGVPLTVLSDNRLPLGGVVVETTRGEFDSSVDVQLHEIERGLTDRLAARA
ncbi:MAG TPA: FliH/SctL family protein [Bryobacteraceae bacterium]|jgi:flagellar assembly protein FliH|nr:FliH/SctL family protein [Bryobacteraceae bacterium]